MLQDCQTPQKIQMSNPKKITRRTALQVGFGAVAGAATGAATGNLLAEPADSASCGTPEQTEGPFYPTHEQADKDLDLTLIEGRSERAEGEVIRVAGQVLDEAGEPVAGALVDVWQANTHGRYRHENDPNPAPLDPNFQGWAQIMTDDKGRYAFKTIVPGAYPVDDEWMRSPHIHFKVSKRGYRELTTQMYFAGHPLNEQDHILLEVSEAERKKVIVEFTEDASGVDDAHGEMPGMKRGRFDLELCRVKRE